MTVRTFTKLFYLWYYFLLLCSTANSKSQASVCEKTIKYASNVTTQAAASVIKFSSNEVSCTSSKKLVIFAVPDTSDTTATFVATFCLRRPGSELIVSLVGGYFHPLSSINGITSCQTTNDTFQRPSSTEKESGGTSPGDNARHKTKGSKPLPKKYAIPVIVTSKSFKMRVLLVKKNNGITTIQSKNYTASEKGMYADKSDGSENYENVPNTVAFFKVPEPVRKLSDCGVERSCIRIGSENCGIADCVYYLTYRTFDQMSMLELEMSGKTTGWVAVGFSSDDKMGADDVIACRRVNLRRNEVVAKSFWNKEYVTPDEKENNFNVTYAKYENGRISCKLTRPLSVPEPRNVNLDLTNDWFQLYALGNVTDTGTMTKHDMALPSEEKISVIQKKNFFISSGTALSFVKLYLCLLVLFHRLIK